VSTAAPPASPEAHAKDGGPGGRGASLVAIKGGIVAFVLTALAAQIVPASIELFGGGLALSTALKLGWFYELAFHHVAVDVIGSSGVTGRLSVAFLSGTGLALWVLFRAGRAAARGAGPSLRGRVLAGAMVGPVYALPIVVVTSLVGLQLHTGGGFLPQTVRFHGVVWQAFVFPALLGIAAGGAGGAMGFLPGGSRAHAWLVGGWRAMLGALGLAAIGMLVLAAVRPQGTATYARAVSSNGPRAALLLLGHHALLMPNQSFFVLGPSMGGCTELSGSNATVPLICPGRLPVLESPVLLDDLARVVGGSPPTATGSIPDRPMPAGYWAFVLVPAIAMFLGGRFAGAGVSGSHRLREALVRSSGAGVLFALLVGVGSWMASASLFVRAADGSGTASLTLGPRPAPTALLALAWGVVGGALGASIRQDEGTPVPVEPDAPVPPNPTSV
jgi:hypothetical protein